MRLFWRPSSRAEERLETWIGERHQERVLAGETTPVGPCPDESFLRDLTRQSKRIALSDPRVSHAASCPLCMSRVLTMRQAYRSRRRNLMLTLAAASCLVIAVALVSLARYEVHKQTPPTNMAVVSETVDLWDAGTLRGEQPGPLQSVWLPAALVKVTVVLPRFSAPGQYAVAVTRDQSGNGVLAQGSGVATSNGDKEQVSVNLDLRKAKTGTFFLSTTHEQDQASYYYPLQIR